MATFKFERLQVENAKAVPRYIHFAVKNLIQCALGSVWGIFCVRPIRERAGSAKPATELRRRITAQQGILGGSVIYITYLIEVIHFGKRVKNGHDQ